MRDIHPWLWGSVKSNHKRIIINRSFVAAGEKAPHRCSLCSSSPTKLPHPTFAGPLILNNTSRGHRAGCKFIIISDRLVAWQWEERMKVVALEVSFFVFFCPIDELLGGTLQLGLDQANRGYPRNCAPQILNLFLRQRETF